MDNKNFRMAFGNNILEAVVDATGISLGLTPKLPTNLVNYLLRLARVAIDDSPRVTENTTIQGLDLAATHLREALTSIDQLKATYVEERDRLQKVSADAEAMSAELQRISREKELAAELRGKDQQALQSLLGLDEINKTLRQGKFSGFIAGVLASLLAWGLSLAIEFAYKSQHPKQSDTRPDATAPQSTRSPATKT